MEGLIRFWLHSLEVLLRLIGLPAADASAVAAAVASGRADDVDRELREGTRASLIDGSVAAFIRRLTRVTSLLSGDTATLPDFEQAVSVMISGAELSAQFHKPSMEYNFYEAAYHLGAIFDRPALDIATKLRELSNPDNVDQYHGAIWRLATESVRDACARQTNWLNCLDAVELALVCTVGNPALQADLFGRFLRQVQKAQGTPIEELAAIVAVQAPQTGWDAAKRIAAMRMVAASRFGPAANELGLEALQMTSSMVSQVMFDDMRQLLAPEHIPAPHVTWHDVTLRHQRLASAVPLGRSLMAAPERTDLLLLDLVHEVGHAFVLQGPVGLRQAAYRAVIHYLELLIIGSAGPEGTELGPAGVAVSATLPDAELGRAAAGLQLKVALQAAIEQAVWTPWLEGVSMYLELLSAPEDDPTEISGVHACIRSLIDFNIPRLDGESDEHYARRFADTSAAEFETFLSRAVRERSRSNHRRYFNDEAGTRRTVSDINCLGYLIVRSVVSSWETTLGRRLVPAIAVKLLINATRAGTFDAFPELSRFSANHSAECQDSFLDWIRSLATLPKEALDDFFTAVDRDKAGIVWVWKDGTPRRGAREPNEAHSLYDAEYSRMQASTIRLALLDPDSVDPTEKRRADVLVELLARYIAWRRLLPVGRDDARMLFLDAPGRVGLSVRTYTGRTREEDAAAEPYEDDPRYRSLFWTLDGGKDESDRLRHACAEAGSARLRTTRIIDFGGHADAPAPEGNTSYVCSFLKSRIARVTPWGAEIDITPLYSSFTELLESRVFPPLVFSDEDNTVASLPFLGRRYREVVPDTPVGQLADSIDLQSLALDTAMETAAIAFAQGAMEPFREIYEQTMRETGCRLAVGRIMHATGFGQPAPKETSLDGKRLPELIFNSEAFSGITRFGAST